MPVMRIAGILLLFLSLLGKYAGITFAAAPERNALRFNSYKVLDVERTSLALDEGRPFPLKKEFRLVFTMTPYEEPVFGSIVALTFNNAASLCLAVLRDDEGKPALYTIYNNRTNHVRGDIQRGVPIEVTITIRGDKAEIKAGKYCKEESLETPGANEASVVFGRATANSSEVLPMDISDIAVWSDNRKIRHWPMQRHTADGHTLDEISRGKAKATNPIWTSDFHYHWREIFSMRTDRDMNFSFDPATARLYLIWDDRIEAVNADGRRLSKRIEAGGPALKFPGSFPFDGVSRSAVSTAFELPHSSLLPVEENAPAWSAQTASADIPHIYNNGYAYNPADSAWYFFGGYAGYKFKNTLYRLHDDNIELIPFSGDISPRMTPALCVVGSNLYIFGGTGNRSGHQELSTTHFCDLYRLDLKTRKLELVWDIPNTEGNIGTLMAPTMYYFEKEQAFYAFSTRVPGRLWRISAVRPEVTPVSAPVNPAKRYKETCTQLYLDPEERCFYLAMDCITNENSHEFKLYRIDLPLLPENASLQEISPFSPIVIWICGISIFICIAVGGFILIRHRKEKKIAASVASLPASLPIDQAGFNDGIFINLQGDFRVVDSEGNDISESFTKRLRDLLSLLIIYAAGEGQGIETDRIDEMIWGDKDRSSARNNRYVSISKLKQLIAKCGGSEIIRAGSVLTLQLGNGVGCDYLIASEIISNAMMTGYDKVSDSNLSMLVNILERGQLLPGLSEEWAQQPIADYTQRAISVLTDLRDREYSRGNQIMAARIARLIQNLCSTTY